MYLKGGVLVPAMCHEGGIFYSLPLGFGINLLEAMVLHLPHNIRYMHAGV